MVDAEKLAEEIATGHKSSFSDDEMEALRSIAQFWIGMQVVGRAAAVFQKIIVFVGWAMASYFAVKGGAFDWVKSVVAGAGK